MKIPVKCSNTSGILVESGQQVDSKTPFYKGTHSRKTKVPLAQLLQFAPKDIFHKIKKVVGDRVKRGDLLADHKKMLTTRQYFSEFSGVITEIDHVAGTVTIEAESENENTVFCFFSGEVCAINSDHIELRVKHAERFSVKSLSKQFGGKVYYFSPADTLDEETIAHSYIFLSEPIDSMVHAKLEALGAKGYITTTPHTYETQLETLILANEADSKQIVHAKHPFMLINADEDTVYFYTS